MPRPITSPLFGELAALGVGFSNTVGPIVATAGSTQSFPDTQQNSVLYLNPAATLATLTVLLPSNAAAVLGQEVKLVCSQVVTALTMNVIGGGGNAVLGLPAGMTLGQTLIFTKIAPFVWAAK